MIISRDVLKKDSRILIKFFQKVIRKLSLKISFDLFEFDLFFNELVSQVENDKERCNNSKTSIAYILITQITLYRILSEKRTDIPKIDLSVLNDPYLIQTFFKNAQKITNNPIFELNIITKLNTSTLTILKDISVSIFDLKPELLNYDILAIVFNSIIPTSLRKTMGVYYSKIETARLLSYLSIDSAGTKILDPACGSGTLLISAYQRKKELLLQKNDEFTIEDHKRFFTSEITGIDVMPFAVYLSMIHLMLQAPGWELSQNRLAIFDSTLINPKTSILTNHSKKGTEKLYLDFVDLVIMNPPFVRQEILKNLRKSYKNVLRNSFQEYSNLIDKKMSYYCYFLLLADKFLRKGGRIATVIPSSFLRTESSFKVRKWLLNEYNICYIIIREDKPYFSEHTSFREIILIAEKGKKTKNITYLILKNFPLMKKPTKKMLKSIKFEDHISTQEWEIRNVATEMLPLNNLFLPISIKDYSLFRIWFELSKNKNLISIDSYLRKTENQVLRGIETSKGIKIQEMIINNSSSTLLRPNDKWIIKNETKTHINAIHRYFDAEIRIPKECLEPHLRRLSRENKLDISKKREYVVTKLFPKFNDFQNLDREIKNNPSMGIPKKWKQYVEERLTNLMIVRRFDISSSGSFLISLFSKKKRAPPGVMWAISGLNNEEAKIICLWFNSTLNLLQIFLNRVETRGAWMQLHEYVINELKLPNISSWTESERSFFISLFDEIKLVEFPPLWQQLAMNIPISKIERKDHNLLSDQYPLFNRIIGNSFLPRKELDLALLDQLKIIPPKEYDSFLQELYLKLLIEIATLKKMMN